MNRGKLNCACPGSRDKLSAKNRRGSGCPLVENHEERASLFRGDAIQIQNQASWGPPPKRKKKNFRDDLSNSGPAVRLYGEGRATGPPNAVTEKKTAAVEGEIMAQYLVAIHHPDNYDPSVEDEAMRRDISALNEEMDAAGARIFAGGLSAARGAKSLRAQPNGKVLITDGPYLETKEHIGGFWILKAADLDEALAWGRRAAVACRAPVEVRPFLRVRPNGSD
jgi:hypothetical protein